MAKIKKIEDSLLELQIVRSQGGYVFRWGDCLDCPLEICFDFNEAIHRALEIQKQYRLGNIVFKDGKKKYR